MLKVSLLVAAAAAVLVPSAPALAHVGVSPETAAPGSFATYTFTVPNERAAEDTVGLDVTLPAGFTVEDAESLPSWRTVIDTRPDGTARAVHWSGGRIPPHTFGRFALRGRTGDAAGVLTFPAVQRYTSGSESWAGAPTTDHPAPIVTVGGTAAAGPQVAAAQTEPSAQAGVDPLARSRSALALMLAVAALLGLAGGLGVAALRRAVTARFAAVIVPGPEQDLHKAAQSGTRQRLPKQRAARR